MTSIGNTLTELQDAPKMLTASMLFADEAQGLWDVCLAVLHNSSQGEKSSTDRYLARHYQTFVKHMMYLKTDGAAEVLIETFTDNREALDDLLDGKYERQTGGGAGGGAAAAAGKKKKGNAGGLDWILSHLSMREKRTDFIDHDFYNLLSAMCVCKGAAVTRAQVPIYKAMVGSSDSGSLDELHKRGHLCKIQVVEASNRDQGLVDFKLILPSTLDDREGREVDDPEHGVLLKGGNILTKGTEDTDMHTYWELDPGLDEAKKLRYEFLMSNLTICAALCDGHWSDPHFNPMQIAHAVASNETLIAILKDTYMPYDIRSVTARLLMEMFLETPGALTVVHDEKVELVSVLDEASSPRIKLASAIPTNTVGEDAVMQGTNNARRAYVLGTRGAVPEALQVVWEGMGPSKRDENITSFTAWVENEFAADLRMFSREMRRLNLTEDKFETWHQQHGDFIIQVLRKIYFATESGYYDDKESITSVLGCLVQGLLFFAGDLLSTQQSVSSVEDEAKVTLITNVVDAALSIVELLEIQQQITVLGTYLADFNSFMEAGSASKAVKSRSSKRYSLIDVDEEDRVPAMLEKLVPKASVLMGTAGNNESHGDGGGGGGGDARSAKLKLKPAEKQRVLDYLDDLHSEASLVSKQDVFGLAGMLESSFAREKKVIADENTKAEQSRASARGGSAAKKSKRQRKSSMKRAAPTRKNDAGSMISMVMEEIGTFQAMPAPPRVEDITHILLQVARYGRPQASSNVVRRAMKMLTVFCSRQSRMFDCGMKVRIASLPASVAVYRNASKVMTRLHYLVYDQQISSGEDGAAGSADEIKMHIDALSKLLGSEDGGAIVYAHQEVLFRMNVLDVVLGIFDQVLDDDDFEDVDPQNSVLTCMVSALDFARKITTNFDDAQEKVFDEMEGLLKNPRIKHPTVTTALAKTLKAVFGSAKYQMKVRRIHLEELVNKLPLADVNGLIVSDTLERRALEKTNAQAYVELLRVIIEPTGGASPISLNQSIVMTLIAKRNLVQALRFDFQSASNTIDLKTMYDVNMLRLLAVLGYGGEIRMIESTCKKLYSVRNILDALKVLLDGGKSESQPKIHALLAFMQTAYLADTCVAPMRFDGVLNDDPVVWKVVQFCTNSLDEFSQQANTAHGTEALQWIFGCIFPFLRIFVKKNLRTPSYKLISRLETRQRTIVEATFTRNMTLADLITRKSKTIVDAYSGDRDWWAQEYTYVCRDTIDDICATFGIVLKELKAWRIGIATQSNHEKQAIAGQQGMQVRVREINELLNADVSANAPKSRMSVHVNHPSYLLEQTINSRFKKYCETMHDIYMQSIDGNAGQHEKVKTAEDGDFFDHLQRGTEYAEYLTLLEKEDDGPLGAQDGVEYTMLLRYLGFLEEVMDDISSTEDDKEEADRLCINTLGLLCAQLDKVRQQEDDDADGPKKGEKLRNAQRAHAEKGAMKHCVRLLEDDEEDLLKAVMNYFSRLLDNGNVEVQEELHRALYERKSTKALINIRDEIRRSLATLSITSIRSDTNDVLDDLQNDEHMWLIRLIKGLQQICEGAYKQLQDILLDQSAISSDKSINFIDELATVLQQTYTKIQAPNPDPNENETEQWYELVEQTLETITEMCQGNQRNQQTVLDKRVMSMLSWIIAYVRQDNSLVSSVNSPARPLWGYFLCVDTRGHLWGCTVL